MKVVWMLKVDFARWLLMSGPRKEAREATSVFVGKELRANDGDEYGGSRVVVRLRHVRDIRALCVLSMVVDVVIRVWKGRSD